MIHREYSRFRFAYDTVAKEFTVFCVSGTRLCAASITPATKMPGANPKRKNPKRKNPKRKNPKRKNPKRKPRRVACDSGWHENLPGQGNNGRRNTPDTFSIPYPFIC